MDSVSLPALLLCVCTYLLTASAVPYEGLLTKSASTQVSNYISTTILAYLITKYLASLHASSC